MLGEMGIRLFEPAPPAMQEPAAERARLRRACWQQAPVARRPRRAAGGPGCRSRARVRRDRAMDWDALAPDRGACQACKLCEGRTQHRVRRRRPAGGLADRGRGARRERGPAGRALRRPGRQAAGQHARRWALDRRDKVYIANVLKCRPPGNRNPEPEEVAQCEPFLRRQVELLQPEDHPGHGPLRGAGAAAAPASRSASCAGACTDYHGVPLVVTYHPAYLLRNLPDKAKAWADLCLAQAADARSTLSRRGRRLRRRGG